MFADGVHAPSVSSLTQGRGLVKSASVRVPGRPTGAEKALKPVILSVGRVEEGRRYRHRRGPGSLPRSSNRTCGFAASGSPTGFTARLTDGPQQVRGAGAARPTDQRALGR